MSLALLVLIPFAGAILVAWIGSRGRPLWPAYAAATTTFSALMLLLPSVDEIFGGATLFWRREWLESVGLAVSFRLDGLGLLFALLILVIGLLVILYARYYLADSDPMGRFYAYLLLFMGSMLGVVLSENLIQLLIFWELTSLSSFLLIGYWRHREDARQGARMALAVTGGGGLALLAGFLLLGEIVGSYELSVILALGRHHPRAPLVRADAGADPARRVHQVGAVPVPLLAAARHGGADAGQRLPAFGDHGQGRRLPAGAAVPGAVRHSAEWFWLVGGAGLLTLLLGAYTALFKHDLKGLLAYSTISHLGLITLLFGLGTPLAAVAARVPHHEPRDLQGLAVHGRRHHRPRGRHPRHAQAQRPVEVHALHRDAGHGGGRGHGRRAAAQRLPLQGDVLRQDRVPDRLSGTMPLAAGGGDRWPASFAVAYSLRFIHDVFFNGEPVDLPRTPHEPPRWMKVPVEILVVICLAVGIAAGLDLRAAAGRRRRGHPAGRTARVQPGASGTASTRRW